jgi:hypothetical protein
MSPDFTKASYYFGDTPLVRHEGEGARDSTETLALRPVRQDVGNNPAELRPESGDIFSQADFSHGALQPYFHGFDPSKYLYSEGFDPSEPGVLKHLPRTQDAAGGTMGASSTGRSCQSQSTLFICDATGLRVYTDITAAPTTEDPHAGEGTVVVNDVTSEGDRVFAALGANGIHVRSAAGVWSHHNDAAAKRVAYIKERLIAASDTALYEITASGAAPTAKLTLKAGWVGTDLATNGQYVYWSAINAAAGLSVVHHFGLVQGDFVHLGTSNFPDNDLVYSILGYLGTLYVGGGRKNSSGGKDPFLYRTTTASGFLDELTLVTDSTGAGAADLSVNSIYPYSRKVLLGWSLGSAAPFGARYGVAVYDPALDSFFHHLGNTGASVQTLSIQVFQGRVVIVSDQAVLYEHATERISTSIFISSVASWRNAGLKFWDLGDITGKPLPTGASVGVDYTTSPPEDGSWTDFFNWTTAASTKATGTIAAESAKLAVRLVSARATDATQAPEIETYSVRSNPTAATDEYRLIRTVRIFPKDWISESGQVFYQTPRAVRNTLKDARNTSVTWYEPDFPNGWSVILKEIAWTMPYQPDYGETAGEPEKEGFICTLIMEGRPNA